MANAFCRRREVQIAGMRLHALMDDETQRKRPDFWGWTDFQDAARACRFAIEKDWSGHEAFFINGDETTLSIPTLEAIVRVYPGVPLRRPLDGFASVLDTSKAERIMGWVHETQWVRNGWLLTQRSYQYPHGACSDIICLDVVQVAFNPIDSIRSQTSRLQTCRIQECSAWIETECSGYRLRGDDCGSLQSACQRVHSEAGHAVVPSIGSEQEVSGR